MSEEGVQASGRMPSIVSSAHSMVAAGLMRLRLRFQVKMLASLLQLRESGEASPAENDEVRNDQYEWQHVDFDPNIGVGLLPPVPIPMSNAAESSRKYNSYAAELVRGCRPLSQ
ncbi:unnamed protein product (mitochondrion) [Plasmodiophora brassicae]|uniref:Uncharacterized protein n=1 Tax=Plasmodiophora brassicae TaxID=37360 RepID=A0A3P3YMT5_PLABS|nr:unnamed protein product [Plasmodiophora brassicae]